MASSVQVVEHVVLFKAKDGVDEASLKAWASTARALHRLDGVLLLLVGSVLSCKPHDGAWSVALYGRYRDKTALHAYSVHPDHLQLVALGSTLFSDIMALDWEAKITPTLSSSSSSSQTPSSFASRIAFVQWKLHSSQEAQISAISSRLHGMPNSTSGTNFSPGRCHGFEWGFLSLRKCKEELEEADSFVETLTNSPVVEKFLLIDVAPTTVSM